MSGRCKSCNTILTDDEMVAKYPNSEEYCDLCFSCQMKSTDEFEPLLEESLDDFLESEE